MRLATSEQIDAHTAAVAAIDATAEAAKAMVMLTHRNYIEILRIFSIVKYYVPAGRARCSAQIRMYNDCINKVIEFPSKLAKCDLPLSPLEEALVTHAPNLLLLATDGKRFKTRKVVSEPRAPVPHVEYGTALEPEPEKRVLRGTVRHRLAGGEDAIRGIISSTLTCIRDGFKPTVAPTLGVPAANSVGAWRGYHLLLVFTNAVDGSKIPMCSDDKRICHALTVSHPFARKRVLDAFGTEINNMIIAKIKDMLRERDIRNESEGLPHEFDAMVYCSENTCEHASGFLSLRGHMTYVTCSKEHHTCLKCMRPRHVGDCDAAAGMDAETRELLVASSKPCPGCHTLITKSVGCNHMTCRCGQHFCWRCLKTFTPQVRWIAHNSDDGVTCTAELNVYGGRYD